HIKFIKIEDFYEFISLFMARRRFTGPQALGYFGAPLLGVVTGLERPVTVDRVPVYWTEASEHGFHLLHTGGFPKFRSERAKIINVVAVLVFLADLIQPLLDYDLLMAIQASSTLTQIQEGSDQILLGAARGVKLLVQP